MIESYTVCIEEAEEDNSYAVFRYCLTESLLRHSVIPDAINKAPEQLMEVIYLDCLQVYVGNLLACREVESAPDLFWKTNPENLHTLVMIDLDSSSRSDHKFREFHHWLVINIPGCKIEEGEVISQYVGIAPPRNSGPHRFVFLAFRQNSTLELSEELRKYINGPRNYRGKFSIQNFVRDLGLWHIPVACNFFIAEWDDDVPDYIERLRYEVTHVEPVFDPYKKSKKIED